MSVQGGHGAPGRESSRLDVLADLAAEMQARIVPPLCGEQQFEPSFPPFDPDLPDADALHFGIPPSPPDPAARQLWQRMVAPPLRILPFRPEDVRLRSDIVHGLLRGFGQGEDRADAGPEQAGAAAPPGRLASSANWSGAAILARRGERYIQVLGSWAVPAVRAGKGDGPWVCSTWIGLDGLRRWMTSMPQMGTTQSLGDTGEGQPANFPWFQWWLRGRSLQLPVPINIHVSPGDRVYCAVTRLPVNQPQPGQENHVQFFFRNGSTATHLVYRAPPDDRMGAPVPSRGASAQWILERPTALHDSPNGKVAEGDLYPLPDFAVAGPDSFAASLAPSPDFAPVVATLEAPALAPSLGFRTPRLLRMVERLRGPARVAVIAVPSRDTVRPIRVTYRG